MPWAAAAAVVGAGIGYSATTKAANTQADAANRATDISNQQFSQNRADMAPWRAAGETALGQLSAGTADGGEFNRNFTLADFQKDPGYQFRMDQGQSALEHSAAARGGLLNGGTLKAMNRYGQDYASGEFQNAYNRYNNDTTQRFNRLASLAGVGQTATRDVANMGMQNATQVGNNMMSAANARASGYMGQANAIGSGINTLGNWYQQNNAMNTPMARYNTLSSAGTSSGGYGYNNGFDNVYKTSNSIGD